ncbi:MAG: hypothetical protein AB1609_16940, partial [Bacillota bacterium]
PDGSDRVNLPITYGLVGFPAFPGLYCSQRDDGSAFLEALGCLARTRGPEQRLFRQAEGYVREHGLQVFGVVVAGKATGPHRTHGSSCPGPAPGHAGGRPRWWPSCWRR